MDILINCYWKCKLAYPQQYTTTEVALIEEDLLEEVGFQPGLKESYGLGGAEGAERSGMERDRGQQEVAGFLDS